MEIKKPQIHTLPTSIENRLEIFKRQHPNIESVLILEDEIWAVNFKLTGSYEYPQTIRCLIEILCDNVEYKNSKLWEWIEQHITYLESGAQELNYATDLKKTIKLVKLLDENKIMLLQNTLIFSIYTTYLQIDTDFKQTTPIIECELLADYIVFQPNVNS